MSQKILVSTITFLILLVVLTILSLLQRNTAKQRLVRTEFAHATTVAEIQSTLAAEIENQTAAQLEMQALMTAKIENQAAAQAEIAMVRATAVKEIERQATKQAETDVYVQLLEEGYQATLAQKLGVQAQLRLNDTIDPTLGTLLATESLRRYHSVEGDVGIRRGIELMSWRQVFTSSDWGKCVRSMSLSADGQRLAIFSSLCRYQTSAAEIKVWDVNAHQEIIRLTPSHDEFPVRGIDLSADGDWLVIYQWGHNDEPHMTKVVAVDTSQSLTQTVSFGTAFNSERKQLALISDDNTVLIWDIATQQVVGNLAHDQKVTNVNFSPDGRWLVTYGEDKIWLWDTNNKILANELPFRDSSVYFSPDSRLLAVVNRSGLTIHIWEVDPWQEIAQMRYDFWIHKVEFSPDSQWLASLDDRGNVQVWATSTGTEITRISLGSYRASTLAFSPNGQWLVTSVRGDKIQIWKTGWWRESARIPDQGSILDFSADSQWLAASGDNSDAAKVWKLESGSEVARFYGASKHPTLSFSDDGQYLAAYQIEADKNRIQIWNIMTQKAVEQVQFNQSQLASFIVTPTNQLKIVQIDAGTLVISDTVTNQEIARMVCEEEMVTDILGFNERLITIGYGQTISLDITGDILAIGGVDDSHNNLVRVWNASTCREKYQLPVTYKLSQISFSPNGQLLAAGTSQIWTDWKGVGEVRIWDVTTGQEIIFVDVPVFSLFFSADNRWLVVNGNRILAVGSGREVTHIADLSAYQAAFSPDNRWLATVSLRMHDEYISVWAWQPADLIALACARVQRNLTKEEWKQYLGDEPYRATCPNVSD